MGKLPDMFKSSKHYMDYLQYIILKKQSNLKASANFFVRNDNISKIIGVAQGGAKGAKPLDF